MTAPSSDASLDSPPAGAVWSGSAESEPPPRRVDARLRLILEQNYEFIWRMLRRFGVDRDSAEDAAQEVFLVAARRLDDIKIGSERAFLFGTAMRIAAEARRVRGKRREHAEPELIDAAVCQSRSPEELVDARRARELLDLVLASMSDEQREVFVLFELEGLEIKEIAALVDIPIGTVGSRLRRARGEFSASAARIRAQLAHRVEARRATR